MWGSLRVSLITLCAFAQRVQRIQLCVCVCVCVCVWPKKIYLHTSLISSQNDSYCSLIHFICHPRYLLDLLSHTESVILLIFTYAIVPRVSGDLLKQHGKKPKQYTVLITYRVCVLWNSSYFIVLRTVYNELLYVQGMCSVEL